MLSRLMYGSLTHLSYNLLLILHTHTDHGLLANVHSQKRIVRRGWYIMVMIVVKIFPPSHHNRSSTSLCHEPLNRVTLHCFTSQSEKMDSAQLARESLAHSFCQELFLSTLTSHAKREAFNKLWPHIMTRMVHRTLTSFADLDQQMKEVLDSL